MIENVISVSNLTKSYDKIAVLDNITFDLKEGKVYGIVGKNGSGKSTLIHCILGLIPWEKGRISILGKDIRNNLDRKYVFSHCSAVLQGTALPKRLKVSECLKLFSILGEYQRNHDDILEKLDLDGLLNQEYGNLSYGQQQKVLLATALLQKFEVILLDEPTNGIDAVTRRQILEFIKKIRSEKKTIIYISHISEDIFDICDDVILIKNNKVEFVSDMDILVQETGGGSE